jgi:hypothetical protein
MPKRVLERLVASVCKKPHTHTRARTQTGCVLQTLLLFPRTIILSWHACDCASPAVPYTPANHTHLLWVFVLAYTFTQLCRRLLTVDQSAAKKLKQRSDCAQDSGLSVAAVAAAVEAPSPSVPPRSAGPDTAAIGADTMYLRLTSGCQWRTRCFIASTNEAQFLADPAYRADPPDEYKASVDTLAEELIQYLKERLAQLKRECALEEESIAGERLWEYWTAKDLQEEVAAVGRFEAGSEISLQALAHIHRLRLCVYEPGMENGSTMLSVKDPRSHDCDAVQVRLRATFVCEGDHVRTVHLLHTGYGGGDSEFDALGSALRTHFDSLLTKPQLDWESFGCSVDAGGAPAAAAAAPRSQASGCQSPSLEEQCVEPHLCQNQMENPGVANAMDDCADGNPDPPFSPDDSSSNGSGDDDADGFIDEKQYKNIQVCLVKCHNHHLL